MNTTPTKGSISRPSAYERAQYTIDEQDKARLHHYGSQLAGLATPKVINQHEYKTQLQHHMAGQRSLESNLLNTVERVHSKPNDSLYQIHDHSYMS